MNDGLTLPESPKTIDRSEFGVIEGVAQELTDDSVSTEGGVLRYSYKVEAVGQREARGKRCVS